MARLVTSRGPVPVLVKVKALGAPSGSPRTAEKTSRGVDGLAVIASSGETTASLALPEAWMANVELAVPTLPATSVAVTLRVCEPTAEIWRGEVYGVAAP